MYTIFYTNIGYRAEPLFNTLQEAIQYGRSKGFEFCVYEDDKMVCVCEGVSLNTRYID